MADFVGVLKKTIDAQAQPTPEIRARIYERARQAVNKKLADVLPPKAVADAQRNALEKAIDEVEAGYKAIEDALLEPIRLKAQSLSGIKAESPIQEAPASEEAPLVEEIPAAEVHPIVETTDSDPSVVVQPAETLAEVSSQPPETGHFIPDAEPVLIDATQDVPQAIAEPVEEYAPSSFELPQAEPVFVTEHSKIAVQAEEQAPVPEPAHSVVLSVPQAEPVNMEAILSAEQVKIDTDRQNYDKAVQASKNSAQAQNSQTGDFDLVSDIFVQAAKRNERKEKKKKLTIILSSLAALVVLVAAIGFVAWDYIGSRLQDAPADNQLTENTTVSDQKDVIKLTQRLLPDGTETDPGPAKTATHEIEGTSTAVSTTGNQPGQAILYEARMQQGVEAANERVVNGAVNWTLLREPKAGGGDELAIRGDVKLPESGLGLLLTIRRNTDETMPAAYLVEMIFLIPDNFEGSSVDNIQEFTFKKSEQSIGQRLGGTDYSKIDNNFFLFAVSDMRPYIDGNLKLMKQLSWLRIVGNYSNGRIFELTLDKGPTGTAIFDEVIDAWLNEQNKPTLFDNENAPKNEAAPAQNQ